MEVNITKPPIPVLWIDTWCIVSLVKALWGKDKAKKELAERTVDLIIKLAKEKKLICPQGDQNEEIEVSNNEDLVEEARKIQVQLAQGISLHYFAAIEDMQVQRMMKAIAEGGEIVEFPWEDIFADNPEEALESDLPFFVSVHIPSSREDLDKRVELNRSIAESWEEIRQEALKNKQKYESKLEQEFGGKAEVFVHVLSDLAAKTIAGEEIDMDTMIRAMEITGKSISWWEHFTGKQNDLKGLVEFFKSEEYKLIPSIRVGTKLLAELVSGNEAVGQGDVMDIHHMSAVLPYANYLVVDKRVKHRIEGNRTKLTEDYDFELIKWQELLPLLEEIDSNS